MTDYSDSLRFEDPPHFIGERWTAERWTKFRWGPARRLTAVLGWTRIGTGKKRVVYFPA